MLTNPGNLYVIAAPSGTGKTTLVKAVTTSLPKTMVSISHTTRSKRPNEIDGVNYHFISVQEFESMIQAQAFLEHARVFDHFYGTSLQWVQETLVKGIDVILEIDWQGHQQIKSLLSDSISIFILPPSLNDLRERLVTRAQDDATTIEKRLADAKETLSHLPEFDYVVINDDFARATEDLMTIIKAGRLLEKHQHTQFAKLIEKLA